MRDVGKITLTVAEEEFGLSDADLPLWWSNFHLNGSWVKKKNKTGQSID